MSLYTYGSSAVNTLTIIQASVIRVGNPAKYKETYNHTPHMHYHNTIELKEVT